jgi:beta-phosphoglucomutase-like phosphatase (HAD superfamily)
MMLLPAAVLWDLDGTLVDSEPYWAAAEHKLAQAHGFEWTEQDELSLVGNALPVSGAALQARGIDLSVSEIVEIMVQSVVADIGTAVPWQPGSLELLAALMSAEVPCALVTMSYQAIADQIVASVPAGTFQAVVSGDNVTHGKPHPEPYILAAERLGVDISRSVAIEDSLTGLASAQSAGARVLAVQRKVQIPAAEDRSRVAELVSLSVEDLSRIAAGECIDRLADPPG